MFNCRPKIFEPPTRFRFEPEIMKPAIRRPVRPKINYYRFFGLKMLNLLIWYLTRHFATNLVLGHKKGFWQISHSSVDEIKLLILARKYRFSANSD